MLMFSRNNHSNGGVKHVSSRGTLTSQDNGTTSNMSRGSVPRRSLLRRNASRPHSWHSTLQRGFQRARSRSSGRGDNNKGNNRSSTSLAQGTSTAHYGFRRLCESPRAASVLAPLREGLAVLTGGRDRRGAPVLTFPAHAHAKGAAAARTDEYQAVIQYLMQVPSDDVRDLCFTVVLDMRGSKWDSVKPILKVLQEHFAHLVSAAYIVKPDNFWQKQRTSIGSQKYKFETHLISLDALHKTVDPSQLTADLEGTLHYDHAAWIEMRCALEDFFWQGVELLDRLETMREELNHNDFADDVSGAKAAMDGHNEAKRRILKVPVENVDNVGQRLLQRLSSCESGNSYDSGYSGRDSSASDILAANPDLQSAIPVIMQMLDQVHSGQQQLLQLWQIKKAKLDQCLQLRLFEQDCEKMFDWILHNRQVFSSSYVSIGHSFGEAKKLQDEHNQFTMGSNNVFANINRILGDAAKLIETNHYASAHVRGVAARLDKTWKDFASCLDERTTVLALSVLFHQKAEQYGANVEQWSQSCDATCAASTSGEIPALESSIHQHQSLYESMCQAYTEVHSTSKKLLYQLDHLVQMSNQTGASAAEQERLKHDGAPQAKDPASDYSSGASHVLSVIHDILAHHRALEAKWHAKKIKLHQRLALRLFQEDVKQVLDWLQNHGEVFLRKNVGIGRNLNKARAYQKSHETFEGVVQNTYTNAEKLLAAAAELAQTGECNAEDIYSVAHELESHISSFAQRVERRRRLLELAILFYSHAEELSAWLGELKAELQSEEAATADSLEGAERMLEQFAAQRDSTLDACASTISEGKTLLEELKSQSSSNSNNATASGNNSSSSNSGSGQHHQPADASGSITAVQTTLDRLSSQRDELGELWSTRKARLDMLLRLRLFERDALELSSQYELWAEQLQGADIPRVTTAEGPKEAEAQLRNLSEHVNHIQTATLEVAQRGQELLQQFESSGVSLMADSQYSGQSRVQVLLEYIQEREIDLEDLAAIRRIKLEQCIQLCQFESDASQVIRWIENAEQMLTHGFSIPGCLQDAEHLKKEHEQFQTAIEKTHASAVHVRQRAETLLTNSHYNPKRVKEVADGVTTRWQGLVTRAEERHKLVTASLNFYKTAEQVCSVLDSLEREYKRDDGVDWLTRAASSSESQDKVSIVLQLINKHQEQKEAFLKACTLARRTAETFLKYSNRSLQYFGHPGESTFRGPEAKVKVILEKLLTQENRVLEYWTAKKKRLDQNQQFCLFERSARQSLAWIKEEGDIYLSTHTKVGGSRDETERLLKEHNSFKEKAKETREKVKLLLQLADTLVDKGHAHAPSIKQWVEEVDATYKDFSARMDQYRARLEASLGSNRSSTEAERLSTTSDASSHGDLSLDSGGRNSDANLEARLASEDLKQIKELNEEKRRSARRKELIMAELLETERTYVKDLELAINCFLKPMRAASKDPQSALPAPLRNKEAVVFCNVEDILAFHKSTFLKELEKYETMPEDVGHCFVTWAPKFDIYVKYCTNMPQSTSLLVAHGGSYFENLQREYSMEHPIAAYLIKPVQRITKYQLLLKDLLQCTEGQGEIREGLDVCLSVPKKANDALHLNMLEGCDVSHEQLGEVVLQDSFAVVDSRQIVLRKAKDRHIFLFDLYLVVCKEVKDSNGKAKYIYKSKLMKSEMGVTEHIEGDECKFAIWTGRTPMSENKTILKASSIEVKQTWVKKLREMIQETYFNTALPNLPAVNSSSNVGGSSTGTPDTRSAAGGGSIASGSKGGGGKARYSRDFDDGASLDGSVENVERGSLASFGSGTTTDSENQKGCDSMTWVIAEFAAEKPGEVSVCKGQQVEVVFGGNDNHHPHGSLATLPENNAASTVTATTQGSMVLVRISDKGAAASSTQEGLVPVSCLKLPPGGLQQLRQQQLQQQHQHGDADGAEGGGPGGGGGVTSSVGGGVPLAGGGAVGLKKKAGFSGKWLPNIRKLSQGKLSQTGNSSGSLANSSAGGGGGGGPVDASGSGSGAAAQRTAGIHKQTSRNKFKLSSLQSTDSTMGNKQSHGNAGGGDADEPVGGVGGVGGSAGGEDPLVEVPPPMQPIASVPLSAAVATPGSGADGDAKNADGLIARSDSNSDSAKNCDAPPAAPPAPPSGPPTAEEVEKAVTQRSFRLAELLETEKAYVDDLGQCVDYIKHMRDSKEQEDADIPMPEALKNGKDRMVFGNIEAIYEWHRDFFLKNLEKSIDKPVDLGNLFKKYDRKFQMYVVYCQNKPKSEFIVSEYIDSYFEEIRLKLGFKLRLTDLLIKPIQRLTKYHLLLEEILKYSQRAALTEEAEALSKALHVMTVVPNQANDMMDIGRLQGFEGKITAQGKLLNRGPLMCLDTFTTPAANGPPKMKPFTVFLFEQILIFSEIVGKKTQFTSPVYVYKAHFLVNKMALDERSEDGDPLKFVIRSNDPAREELRIVCQADDAAAKSRWVGIMKKQLQTQMDFLRALQAPIAYHSKLAKESSQTQLWEVADDEEQATLEKRLAGATVSDAATSTTRGRLPTILSNVEQKNGQGRRWSESGGGGNEAGVSVGSIAKVLVDYKPVREGEVGVAKGQSVRVVEADGDAYKVVSVSSSPGGAEGWVPGYVLNLLSTTSGASARKSSSGWNLRSKFRRPSFGRKDSRPELTVSSASARAGEAAVLKCARAPGAVAAVRWSRSSNGVSQSLSPSAKYSFEHDEHQGVVAMYVAGVEAADAGEYHCAQQVAGGQEVVAVIHLKIKAKLAITGQPRVESTHGINAILTWSAPAVGRDEDPLTYTVEACKLHSNEWLPVRRDLTETRCLLEDLEAGETYGFRVVCHSGTDSSQPSPPSQPLSVPMTPDAAGLSSPLRETRNSTQDLDSLWQRDFERQYIELEELGRGRCSVVRRCQEILSGEEVAVKFVNRRRQGRERTRREYELMRRLHHPNVARAAGLFLTATSDAIVMKLVNGASLFEHLCERTRNSESTICAYMGQVLQALYYIHSQGILYLDLKPENVLLDTRTNQIKLIDFGAARDVDARSDEDSTEDADTSSGPEFLAPEVISRGPLSAATDMWSLGVLLYVSLSGLSPFLDDSDDETTANILRCDFSFPDEYFAGVSAPAKDLVSRLLRLDPSSRASASAALASPWVSNRAAPTALLPSSHLAILVRRRFKKLNTVAPASLASRMMQQQQRGNGGNRPESLYRTTTMM